MGILSRLERLDRLESWLKSENTLVLRDAAIELGVSLRTVHRDLELLRNRSVPVESDRGRGGGVRVSTGWGIGRITLLRYEVLDLLVGLAISDIVHGPLRMGHSGAIRRKLIGTFSHADQQRISMMRKRIRVGGLASTPVIGTLQETSQQVGDELKEAFALNRLISMRYRDQRGTLTEREFELHFLVLNPPVWYAVGWDLMRKDIRSFRCDRIVDAEVSETVFKPRPWSDFASSMEGNSTKEV